MRGKFRSIISFVLLGLLLGVVVAGVAVSYVAVKITQRPQTYVSLAKLVAGGRMAINNSSGVGYQEYLNDFYGTIIETLESGEMRKHAMDRVRILHPELKEADVEIRVSQNKGSAIFNVASIASDRKYAQVFLDALLDEFKAFRETVREQQRNKAVQALAEDVVSAEKVVNGRTAKLDAFRKDNNIVVLNAQQAEQSDALKALLAEKRRLESPPNAPVPVDKEATEKQLATVTAKLTSLKEEVAATSSKIIDHDHLKKEVELAETTRKEVFDLMHKFTVSEEISGDHVSIMERASKAVEDVQSWQGPVLLYGGLSFMGIFFLTNLVGLCWVFSRPRPKTVIE